MKTEQQNKISSNLLLSAVNPFILQTSKDYDMTYEAVEVYYNRYGATPMLYEKLEQHLKERSF